jgi:hypothetical protein
LVETVAVEVYSRNSEAAQLGKARRVEVRVVEIGQEEIDRALTTFQSPKLQPREAALLAWARDTVHYQTGPIQQATRALCAEIGELALLEAVGVASLANSTVRVAMLLE